MDYYPGLEIREQALSPTDALVLGLRGSSAAISAPGFQAPEALQARRTRDAKMQNAINISEGFLELAPLPQGAGAQGDRARVSSGLSSWLKLWGYITAPALKLYHNTPVSDTSVTSVSSASTIQGSKKSTIIRDTIQTTPLYISFPSKPPQPALKCPNQSAAGNRH